jgi:type II secretory pathway predicted ATPase ExeA
MYESFFSFAKRPFASVPQVEQYFPAAAIENARGTLSRCLARGAGAGLVVGPSGTGKTMLLRVLAHELRDRFGVALLSCGRLSSRRALFQAILHELDQRIRGLDEGELRLALIDYLTVAPDRPGGLILLVDEAHRLPLSVLEEIRMLTNLAADGQPAVRVALAGSALLEERFASPKLDSFSQRVVARCYLEAMGHAETRDYVRSQLERAGGNGKALLPDAACEAVHQATDGVPRLVNQLCDHALLLAYASGVSPIGPALIQEAWADLQQLPTPWNADEPPEGGVIEFGGLDDDALAEADEQNEAPEAAVLRFSPDTTCGEEDEDDPAGQVERIEAMLADVEGESSEDDPSSVRLEVVFDSPDELLSAPFDEEEVLSDRVAPREDIDAEPARVAERTPVLDEPDWEEPHDPAVDELPAGAGLEASPAAVPMEATSEWVAPQPEFAPGLVALAVADGDFTAAPAESLDSIGKCEPEAVPDEATASEPCPSEPRPAAPRPSYNRLFAKLRYG